jgi:hypothetical protein
VRVPGAGVGFAGERRGRDLPSKNEPVQEPHDAAERGDEADEAFAGTMTIRRCRLMPAPDHY